MSLTGRGMVVAMVQMHVCGKVLASAQVLGERTSRTGIPLFRIVPIRQRRRYATIPTPIHGIHLALYSSIQV